MVNELEQVSDINVNSNFNPDTSGNLLRFIETLLESLENIAFPENS